MDDVDLWESCHEYFNRGGESQPMVPLAWGTALCESGEGRFRVSMHVFVLVAFHLHVTRCFRFLP